MQDRDFATHTLILLKALQRVRNLKSDCKEWINSLKCPTNPDLVYSGDIVRDADAELHGILELLETKLENLISKLIQ